MFFNCNVDEQLNYFDNNLKYFYEKHIRVRTKFLRTNRQFASVPLPLVNTNFCDSIRLNQQQTHAFNFIHFRQEEVLKSFIDDKSNAIGYDGMHPKFITLTLPYTLIYFTHFFNTIVTTPTYPSVWKHAKIVPWCYIALFIEGLWEISLLAN